MFLLAPGTHTVGRARRGQARERVEPDAEVRGARDVGQPRSNIKRACTEGLIDGTGLCNALLVKVEHARGKHAQGDHDVEQNVLGAWINQLEAQRGKKVELATANRFIAFATDLIARRA